MLTYNFSYPHHQGISWVHHYPYGTSNDGNRLVLNLSTPNASYYGDDYDGNSNIGDTDNKSNDPNYGLTNEERVGNRGLFRL